MKRRTASRKPWMICWRCWVANARILFARELTKKFEQLHACPLADAPAWLAADDNHRRGEFVLVIGPPPASGPTTAMSSATRAGNPAGRFAAETGCHLAARITGARRNALYELALTLKQET
jgi:16S rRNA (cytidine1402-2'-O)-methyltransferase